LPGSDTFILTDIRYWVNGILLRSWKNSVPKPVTTGPISIFVEPNSFSTPHNLIPRWVKNHYRHLCLTTDHGGYLFGGYAHIAYALGVSKPFAIRLVRWLRRLKLLAVVEPGHPGRGRSTTWQLRRWFVHIKPLKGNRPLIRIDVRTNSRPYREINSITRAALTRQGDTALMLFFQGNDLRLAKRIWHALCWKTKPAFSWLEGILKTLECTHIHRPKKLKSDSDFIAWFKWVLKRIIHDGKSWRERFEAEFDHRIDGKRLKATLKNIEDSEEEGKPCPICQQIWTFGDREHECANWVWRHYDCWREQEWQIQKVRESGTFTLS
jgi:hypothetical protein